MINNGRLDWTLHRKLSYISVKPSLRKKILPPLFAPGASCAHWV